MYKFVKKARSKFYIKILITIISIMFFCMWQNNSIVITKSSYKNSKIPNEFDDFIIAHISDLHNKEFGAKQERILEKLRTVSPDAIFITGDLIDRRRYDLKTAMVFVSGAARIAPIYYVPGNHEAWSNQYANIRKELIGAGAEVLDDSIIEISKGKESINLLGVMDPGFASQDYMDGSNISNVVESLEKSVNVEGFKILLSHRPELIDIYAEYNIDLAFAGHAHGGQFRLPGIGGLVAPQQGLFPKYTSGSHRIKETTMFVSRGLGNSIVPIRIFNRPEIVVVKLEK